MALQKGSLLDWNSFFLAEAEADVALHQGAPLAESPQANRNK